MDSDEREIFQFLKTRTNEFVNAVEVCRRAGSKKRFYTDPGWAKPILNRMEERGILESDGQARYRIKPVMKKNKKNQWVAPDIAKILRESGIGVDGAGTDGVADDEYYDQL